MSNFNLKNFQIVLFNGIFPNCVIYNLKMSIQLILEFKQVATTGK